MEVKEIELRCDDHAENIVFRKYEYESYLPDSIQKDIDFEINLEDSYCRTRCNRFVRAWKAFCAKPIYYSGIYTRDKEKVRKWLLDCLALLGD